MQKNGGSLCLLGKCTKKGMLCLRSFLTNCCEKNFYFEQTPKVQNFSKIKHTNTLKYGFGKALKI